MPEHPQTQRAEFRIVPALGADHIAAVRELFLEYAASLNFDLCFQNFESELAALPGDYAPPRGELLLAINGTTFTGCVAMRPLESDICEMKRLYLRLAYRGSGAGRRLAAAIIDSARRAGYRRMRLDTIGTMSEAIALYRSLGFREIAPYRHNPIAGASYFELEL